MKHPVISPSWLLLLAVFGWMGHRPHMDVSSLSRGFLVPADYADLPVAWTCETEKDAGESLTIKQVFNTPTIFWVDWGDGTAPQAFRVTSTKWAAHQYAQAGTYTVRVHACEDYVQRLELNNQKLRGLDISGLSAIVYCNARSNLGMMYFTPPAPALRTSAHPFDYLDIGWSEIPQDTLDLSGFPLLRSVKLGGNRISVVLVNELPALEGLSLIQHKRTLNCTLDLRASHQLRYLACYGGVSVGVAGTEVRILLDSVPDLWKIEVQQTNLVDTLDLSTATSLEYCHASNNVGLISFIPPKPSLRTATHPLDFLAVAWSLISQDSLDISGFPSLRVVQLGGNRISVVLVNDLPALESLNLIQHKGILNCTLDLQVSHDLQYLACYGGGSLGVGSEVRILLDFVPSLRKVEVQQTNLVDTLDLGSAASLEYCEAGSNPSLSYFIPPDPGLRMPSHPLDYLSLHYNRSTQDSLDLSNFPLLRNIHLPGNHIPMVFVHDLPSLQTLNLIQHFQTLNCTLDLRASHKLQYLGFYRGNSSIGVGTEVRVLLDSVPDLQTVHADRTNLMDTLDLSTVQSLISCILNNNQLDAEATLQTLIQSGLTASPPTRTINVKNNLVQALPASADTLTSRGWTVTY